MDDVLVPRQALVLRTYRKSSDRQVTAGYNATNFDPDSFQRQTESVPQSLIVKELRGRFSFFTLRHFPKHRYQDKPLPHNDLSVGTSIEPRGHHQALLPWHPRTQVEPDVHP